MHRFFFQIKKLTIYPIYRFMNLFLGIFIKNIFYRSCANQIFVCKINRPKITGFDDIFPSFLPVVHTRTFFSSFSRQACMQHTQREPHKHWEGDDPLTVVLSKSLEFFGKARVIVYVCALFSVASVPRVSFFMFCFIFFCIL